MVQGWNQRPKVLVRVQNGDVRKMIANHICRLGKCLAEMYDVLLAHVPIPKNQRDLVRKLEAVLAD